MGRLQQGSSLLHGRCDHGRGDRRDPSGEPRQRSSRQLHHGVVVSCTNKIKIYRGLNNDRAIQFPCGSTTGPDGKLVQCAECHTKDKKRYPLGWRNVPGDTCKHGTYVGGPSGPDHICGHCEDEN